MIGSLRERVTIEAAVIAVNDRGDEVESWSTLATVWGRMEPKAATAIERAARETVDRRWMLTIRYRSDVTAAHRVNWSGRIFDIDGVMNPDERNAYLRVDLIERNTQ